MRRSAAFAAMVAMAAGFPAAGYYDFLHYGPNGQVLAEKFNLLQLPSKTVTFFVSGAGPSTYSATDSFPSVVNQIRQAAQVWNGVQTSDLRVAFGGIYSAATQDNSPGGDVVFEQMPPGVLAYSGPTTCEDTNPVAPCQTQTPGATDTFVPILRSTMHMSIDLTKIPGPSFSETFFLVSLHEMGHALGLQHTFTSATMSTISTRASSLTRPIDADDIAGISLLYPAAAFAGQFGSITGRVTYADDGSPAHMASVIAIRSGAPAVSALTLPDGTFRIDGIPQGQYFLYAHPLPPTADIRSPLDPNGNEVAPGRPFNAVLYPGTMNLINATPIGVTAGNVSAGYNFSVAPRSSVPIYDVSMYSYFTADQQNYNAVHPAYISKASGRGTLAASGIGLGTNGVAAPGLSVQVLGGSASIAAGGAYGYGGSGYTYLAVPLTFSPLSVSGLQTLLFATPDYLYVLPSAFNMVAGQPPFITSTGVQADGTLTVTGTGFDAATRVYFDALPARTVSRDPNNAFLTVQPPVGASSQTATLTAYNGDGQNSMFFKVSAPPTYSYASVPVPSILISPATLPAGAEASVDIAGTNTDFVPGHSTFGFGSHDVVIRQTFVLSPTHAIVDVGMPPGAATVNIQVTALTDFQLALEPNAFQIQPPQPGLPAAVPILFNSIPGQSGSYGGAIVSLYGSNLQADANTSPSVTFGGTAASLLYASPNLINLTIPVGLATGLTTLLVNNGAGTSYPVVVNIDPPPPVIVAIEFSAAQVASPLVPASAGITLHALLTGFAPAGSTVDPSRVSVSVGGLATPATAVTAATTPGVFDVAFVVPQVTPGAQVPLIVYIDGRSSVQTTIAVE